MHVESIGPIIYPGVIPKNIDSSNINGPTVFRRPSFLGKYYPHKYLMFFAHHGGSGIHVAGTDDICQSWEVYPRDFITLRMTPCKGHIASPDVIISEDKLTLYYHGPIKDGTGQATFVCETLDGLNFRFYKDNIGHFYWRNFFYRGEQLAIARTPIEGARLYRRTGELTFEIAGKLLPRMRHCCLDVQNDVVKIYWSQVFDAPEQIYRATLNPETCEITDREPVYSARYVWQGSKLPVRPSNYGATVGVNQLRDPFVFRDGGNTYLFYSYMGEEGIGVAIIHED